MQKVGDKNLILLVALVIGVLIINATAMFAPMLTSGFGTYYASIAKNMLIHHTWSDLIFLGKPWLDKPHFPFWLTALSFKIFTINSFFYILPGFIFYLIGLIYTYKLANLLYSNFIIAIISVLLASTSLHLLISSIDIRAEAYLIGQILPACYYWLLYDRQTSFRCLFLAALFTALALMTKGLFVFITIFSGLVFVWLLTNQVNKLFSLKWLAAFTLSLLFITPELIALYVQFDVHTNANTGSLSGIKWYFWGSQFGRFFNIGRIKASNSSPWHYLFFVHTFLWAYLPWWPVFILATVRFIKNIRRRLYSSSDIFVFASFFITFILFSLTSFQVDHYTNIIFPFASIVCAKYLYDLHNIGDLRVIYWLELIFSLIMLALVTICAVLVFNSWPLYLLLILCFIVLLCFILLYNIALIYKTIIYPSLAILLVFVFINLFNSYKYITYDASYNVAQYLNVNESPRQIIDYKLGWYTLDFYTKYPYTYITNLDDLNKYKNKSIYIVARAQDIVQLQHGFNSIIIVKKFVGLSIQAYIHQLFKAPDQEKNLDSYVLIKVN